MYMVQHRSADPSGYRHRESEAACMRFNTEVTTNTDTGIKSVKMHVYGPTQKCPPIQIQASRK